MMTTTPAESLLSVRNLRVELPTEFGTVHALNGIDLELEKGEVLGIVGESGCGKSMTALSIMRLIPEPGEIVAGTARFLSRDLLTLSPSEIRAVRGNEIGMIFQDPMSSLNPVMPIGLQLGEQLELHLGLSKSAARRRAIELLDRVGIPEPQERIDDHAFEFSGGMRQRVMIAMAISCEPKVLIADEPTTALDVTIQAQILELLQDLRRDLDTAIILISHDLGVIAGIADRVLVMYAGRVVEMSSVDELFVDPRHPYTIGLLNSISRIDQPKKAELPTIEGQPPDLINPPNGCAFWHRCSFRKDLRCEVEVPPLLEVAPEHWSASFYESDVK